MGSNRQVVGNPFENQIPTVSPTASPVDVYQRGVVKKSPFEALARTLSNLERKATPIFQAEEKRRGEAEYARGIELYNETRVSIGDAVRDGVIEEGESPYLRKGYRVSHLNAMSARYASELENALITKKLYTNGDPTAVEAFTTKFYTDFQEKNGLNDSGDTELATYFSEPAAKANETFRSSWKSKHTAWQKAANYDAWANEVSAFTDTLFLDDDTPEARLAKMGTLSTWINEKVKLAEVDGMDRKKVKETILNSIILSAYEKEDLSILDTLDNIVTGTGILGRDNATRLAVLKAGDDIAADIATAEVAQAKALKERNEQYVSSTQTRLTSLYIMRENQGDPAEIGKIDNQIADEMNELRRLGRNGNSKAQEAYQSLFKFGQAQQKVWDDNFNVDDQIYAAVLNSTFTLDNQIDVVNTLTRAVNENEIKRTDMGPMLTIWNNTYGGGNLDWLVSNSASKVARASAVKTATESNRDDSGYGNSLAGDDAGYLFDQTYMEYKAEWMVANPDTTYSPTAQYNVSAQALEMVKRRTINPDMQITLAEQQNQNLADRLVLELEAEALANAAALTGDGTGPTVPMKREDILNTIRGGSN